MGDIPLNIADFEELRKKKKLAQLNQQETYTVFLMRRDQDYVRRLLELPEGTVPTHVGGSKIVWIG